MDRQTDNVSIATLHSAYVKCQIKFVERIDSNNTSNALNALMIRKKCRLQLSAEGVETQVLDPADHPAVNSRALGSNRECPMAVSVESMYYYTTWL